MLSSSWALVIASRTCSRSRCNSERRGLANDRIVHKRTALAVLSFCQCTNEKLAGREGFEPSIPDPKSGALPLGDRPSPNFYKRSSSARTEGRFIRDRELFGSRLRRPLSDTPRLFSPRSSFAFRY